MDRTSQSYAALVDREKKFYAGERPSASIPPIFTWWASQYLSPRFRNLFGASTIEDAFVKEILRVSSDKNSGQNLRILSLGSGECSLEIDIARGLKDTGVSVLIACTDISPSMLTTGRRQVAEAGLLDNFVFIECDVNDALPSGKVDFVIANHCLHHFVELECIFNNVRRVLVEGGAFITSDMIGRNGHMRWPEALSYVCALWDTLPVKKRFDHINALHRKQFIDHDCAQGTFEGIRAQDILRLCLENFHFERFLGYGGVVDVFVDRMYGPNFSDETEEDRAFIHLVDKLNADLLIARLIKPTIMFATMRTHPVDCVFDPLSPREAVRVP